MRGIRTREATKTGPLTEPEFARRPGSATVLFARRARSRRRPVGWLACGRGSVGRASPCQGEGRGFESRRPLGDAEHRRGQPAVLGIHGEPAGCGLIGRRPGSFRGGVAEWFRQGPAKPCTRVRFPSPPPMPERHLTVGQCRPCFPLVSPGCSAAWPRAFPGWLARLHYLPGRGVGPPSLPALPARTLAGRIGLDSPPGQLVVMAAGAPQRSGRLASSRAVGAAGARLPDTEKVRGSNPLRPTQYMQDGARQGADGTRALADVQPPRAYPLAGSRRRLAGGELAIRSCAGPAHVRRLPRRA